MLEFKFTPPEADQRIMDQEPNALKAQIEKFVSNPAHVIDVRLGIMCSDGRYERSDGSLSRFGGTAGYVLGLMGLNREFELGLTPETMASTVVEASGGYSAIHTNCGHMAKPTLSENADSYKLDPLEVSVAMNFLKGMTIKHPEMIEVVEVDGPHMEGAVIINTGEKNTLVHRDGNEEYFVIDDKLDEEKARELYENLEAKFPQLKEKGVTFEDYKKILDEQRDATAHILATGMQIFKVNVDGETPIVEEVGTIQ